MTHLQEAAKVREEEPGASPAELRDARRTALRVFRPRRSVPAIIAALCVAGVGGVVLMLSTSQLGLTAPGLQPHEGLVDTAVTPWESPGAMVVSAAAAALGLTLIVTALLPGAGAHTALRTDVRDTVVGVSGRALRALLTGAAYGVDGVVLARVRMGRRSVRVRVRAHVHGADGLRQRVEAVVLRRLEELAPLRPPRVVVRVRVEA
ncbi:DUF6286 domain-containing protein [Nocardiopsis lucentensis]|uniref:DUF6286 domain-containing protein n=1 Tax=Nocardiopsis lucentensis TaxID=53441 RepID=UPI0003461B90|nr:DUF6286 domain-containing protein [Nocardiopsis lucentensis]